MDYQPQPYIYASEVGQTPPTPPVSWWQAHKALLIKVGVGVLGLVVVGLVILFFAQRMAANRMAKEAEREVAEVAVSQASAECASTANPEKCNATIAADLAQSSGKVSFCSALTLDAYDNCVGLAALTAKSLPACEQMLNDEKKAACLQAVDSLLRPVEYTVAPETQAAIDARNPDLCAVIADENTREICVELVGVADRDLDGLNEQIEIEFGSSDALVDSDGDALSDADEVNIWKTNPALADTDGDSYSDGTEVKAGYNPLGT